MDKATAEVARDDGASMGRWTLAQFKGEDVQARAMDVILKAKDWPEDCYWKQVSPISRPEGSNAAVLNFMNPDHTWTGYSVHWYRTAD